MPKLIELGAHAISLRAPSNVERSSYTAVYELQKIRNMEVEIVSNYTG